MARFFIGVLFAVSAIVAAGEARAASRTNLSRAQIRAMPMVARPNRPGHFIGNTVRRFTHR